MSSFFVAGVEGKGADAGSGMVQFMILIAIMFGIMYFMLIRPQKKKEKNRVDMLSRLKKDDKVVTIGGMIGVIQSINDREVVLRTEDGNKIRFTRSAISRAVEGKDQEEAK
ncbi:MAG TPA: preprotein translocase subunit YajC [Planctomycetota bacterium]|nr:preprotein translocase subunit YajC [Planctomycetota bacterium]